MRDEKSRGILYLYCSGKLPKIPKLFVSWNLISCLSLIEVPMFFFQRKKQARNSLLFRIESSELWIRNTFQFEKYIFLIWAIFFKLKLASYFWRNFICNIKNTHTKYIYICVFFNIILMPGDMPFKWTHFLNFPQQNVYAPHLFFVDASFFTQNIFFCLITRKILWALQNMEFLTVKPPPVLHYLVPLKAKHKKIFCD
jgi:hypothetical protein